MGVQQIAKATADLSSLTVRLQNLVAKFKLNASQNLDRHRLN